MWIIIKSKFQKEDEAGSIKSYSEQHLFDAVSWTEAETRFNEQFHSSMLDPRRTIVAMPPLKIADILGDSQKAIWYKVKYSFLSVTDSGKEKKTSLTMLVNADNLEDARKVSEVEFNKWLITCSIDSIVETQILEVFPFASK